MDMNVGSDGSANDGMVSNVSQQHDDDNGLQLQLNDNSHLPPHFSVMLKGSIYDEGEESFLGTIAGLLNPYGIYRFTSKNSHNNKDTSADKKILSMYPRKRFTLVCGSCKVSERDEDRCGFKMRMLFTNPSNGLPHLEVTEFCLPATSKHLLVSSEAREKSASKVLTNEDMLTPRKEKLLKAMGKSRAQSHTVRTVMTDQFGVKLDHNLMHRVMRKGRVEAWGGDEHESNLIFYAEGIKLKDHDSRYGVSGKFATTHCSQTPTLLSWMEQTAIEVRLV